MKDGQALLMKCKYDSRMIRDRRRIMFNGVSLEDLTITRVLSMKPEMYSTRIKHALAAKT